MLLIGLIGLMLGYLASAEVILPFYGLMFLLAVPLLGLSAARAGPASRPGSPWAARSCS